MFLKYSIWKKSKKACIKKRQTSFSKHFVISCYWTLHASSCLSSFCERARDLRDLAWIGRVWVREHIEWNMMSKQIKCGSLQVQKWACRKIWAWLFRSQTFYWLVCKVVKKKKRYYHCVHFSVSLHFLLLKCDFWKLVKSPTPMLRGAFHLFPSECVCDSRLISSLELLFCTCLSSVFSYSHVIFQHVTSIFTCPPSCGSSGYYTVCNL